MIRRFSLIATLLLAAGTAVRAQGVRPAGSVLQADSLRARGQLAAADSVYLAIVLARSPDFRSAAAGSAELAGVRGAWHDAVDRATSITTSFERDAANWSSRDVVAAGRAYAVLGARDPRYFHNALQAFDRATAMDSTDIDAQLRAADLLLDKYNAPDARESYRSVLKRVPGNARALFGLARALAFEGDPGATDAVRQSLAADPELVPALLLLAEQHLQAEAYDSATVAARRALAIDPSAIQGWGVLGAIAWMQGDSAKLAAATGEANGVQRGAVDFYSELAEAAGRQRRYSDAVTLGQAAVRADSQSPRAVGVLAANELRVGDMINGRADLERAFVLDPYNLWQKNLLDLLDNLRGFKTINTARFQFVAPPAEADYLALYLGPLLEAAYDTFAVRYDYRPPTPIRVELYGRSADFSVRAVGLTGIGALGVSFGGVLVMDSPHARDVGELNYGSTAWHELAHTFTLGRSLHRVPRWISEGLSVLEERRAGRGWGFEVSADFLATYKGGALPSASHINEGLVRPGFPAEIGFTYYEASLVCAMIEGEHGVGALRGILSAYAEGLDTPGVLNRVLGITPAAFDQHFDRWLRTRFATVLAALDSSDGTHPATGPYVTLVEQGTELFKAGRRDSARALLRRAQQIFPDDGTIDGPAWQLAHLDRDQGNLPAAISEINAVTMHSETAAEANAAEATLRLQVADSLGALQALEREQWIDPYNIPLHLRIAELSEASRDLRRAVLERRAIVALGPPDSLEARYQLARTLLLAGDRPGARREILQVLESAPSFEKAQALLLELQGRHP